MNIAIIPARGGSKRIPRKNAKLFLGKPIIVWSIETAIASGCFTNIIVSTDDAEIAEIATAAGAEVPFVRPVELSDDYTGTIPVVRHAIEWLNQNGSAPNNVCCIYPTAPLLRAADVQQGLEVLEQRRLNFVLSVTSFAFPIQRALRIDAGGHAVMLRPEHFATRSQDLEETCHDAGQFYWGSASAWLTNTDIFGAGAGVVRLPRERVQDIDTAEDWVRAELLGRLLSGEADTSSKGLK